MSKVVISAQGLGKKYKLGTQNALSIADRVRHLIGRGVQQEEQKDFWALNDFNIEIEKGDAIGIIGKNGAGKSTLLKILSRITHPTTGRFEINGRVSSLLEVGTGFHPELSGRENIFLNGTILGMSRKEINAKLDEIIAFSGVEKFINTPVKHYSSGMYVRLAFSVAAHLEPDVLIIDEVLAVGDMEFQKKCLGKMNEVTSQGRTVLFVSHNLGAVRNLCNRAILLQAGTLKGVGPTEEMVRLYESAQKIMRDWTSKYINGLVCPEKVAIGSQFDIALKYHFEQPIINPQFSLIIKNEKDERVFIVDNSRQQSSIPSTLNGDGTITCSIQEMILLPGVYTIDFKLWVLGENLDAVERIAQFESFWNSDDRKAGLSWQGWGTVYSEATWKNS